jgi:hypothetical protein
VDELQGVAGVAICDQGLEGGGGAGRGAYKKL